MSNNNSLKACPVGCARCDWLGVSHADHQQVCPQCGTQVNRLKQKGLDSLRIHYRLLLKIGHHTDWTIEQRAAEQRRLESFFESIGRPL